MNPKKVKIFLLLSTIVLSFLYAQTPQYTIEDYLTSVAVEEFARYHFSQAIENWGVGNYLKAKEYIDLAFQKPMYPTDIPKLWYFLAKMDIETGNVYEAIQSLENVLFLQPDRTEIVILLKSIRSIQEMANLKNPILGLEFFEEILGYSNFIEFFYNPVASERYLESIYILDRANHFIYVSSKKGNEVVKLPLQSPTGIVIDPISGILYVSDITEGKVHAMNIKTREFIRVFEGFSKPFIKAVDRIGNIYVLDPPNNKLSVMTIAGTVLKQIFLSEGFTPNLVTDVDVDFDLLVLQDMTLKGFRVLQIPSYEEMVLIPFMEGRIPICSTFDGMGNLITLWNEGELTFRDFKEGLNGSYQRIDLTNIILDGISDIDYTPPLLTFTDFDDHLVKSYVVTRTNPEALNIIDGMYIEEENMNIYFRNQHISGNSFQMNFPFLNVIDSGGFVPFTTDFLWKDVVLTVIEKGKEFFENDFQKLQKNQFNVILWFSDGYEIPFEKIAPALLAKNVRLYVLSNLSVSSNLSKLSRITGGMVLPPEFQTLLKSYFSIAALMPFSHISYRMTLPFEGIKIVTLSTRVAGMDYSDSVYYVSYMIPDVKESLIDTLR